jgi:predicted deacylase
MLRHFFLITAFSLSLSGEKIHAYSVGRYHEVAEINDWMQELARKNPKLLTHEVVGQSRLGRDIAILTLGRGDRKVYLNATHHGNEPAATEALLGVTAFLVTQSNRTDIRQLLASTTIVIQPLVNPDGHAARTRGDSTGLDLNRDYWSPANPEQARFAAVETRLVRQLMVRHKFHVAASWHAGMEGILWPWGWTQEAPSQFQMFRDLSRAMAHAMGLATFKQSWSDYPTTGEFTDWAWARHKTAALTVEVSSEAAPHPSELSGLIRASINGTLKLLQMTTQKNRSEKNTH